MWALYSPSSKFVFCLKASTAISTSNFNRHFSPSIELSQFRPRVGLPPTPSILWCKRDLATAPSIMRCQNSTFSKIQFFRGEIAPTGRCQPQIKTFPTPYSIELATDLRSAISQSDFEPIHTPSYKSAENDKSPTFSQLWLSKDTVYRGEIAHFASIAPSETSLNQLAPQLLPTFSANLSRQPH